MQSEFTLLVETRSDLWDLLRTKLWVGCGLSLTLLGFKVNPSSALRILLKKRVVISPGEDY